LLKYDDDEHPLEYELEEKRDGEEEKGRKNQKPGKIHDVMTFNLTLISFSPAYMLSHLYNPI
jgi:hypothetical protein